MSAVSARIYDELNAIAVELNASALARQRATDGPPGEKWWGHPRAAGHGVGIDAVPGCDRGPARRTGTAAAGQSTWSSPDPPGRVAQRGREYRKVSAEGERQGVRAGVKPNHAPRQ